MRIDVIRKYIQQLSMNLRDEVLGTLSAAGDSLDRDEKNLIFFWLFPPLLQDRGLPGRIKEVRTDEELIPSDSEIVMLVGAYRSVQYGNFIRHLLHAFTDPTKVFPFSGDLMENECSICGKDLHPYGKGGEVAYGSTESSIHLCLKCLLNLQALHGILKEIEGEDYLNRYKR